MVIYVIFLIISSCQRSLSYQNWQNPRRFWDHGHDYDSDYNNRVVFPGSDEDYYPTWWQQTTTRRPLINNIPACVSSCPVTSYNPVCGTDDVTYQNIDRLQCVVRCGLNIQIKQWSACKTDSVESKNNLQNCINKCPVTPEYLPVCGTDNVTYNNIGKLYCAQNCGVRVQLKRNAPCPSATSTATVSSIDVRNKCIFDCPTTSDYNPVCGSDGITYSNVGKLDCAKKCGVDVTLKGRTACFFLSTTTSPQTTTLSVPFPAMTTQSTGFRIPKNILDQIFTNPLAQDDNVSNIDPRFNSY